MPKMTAENFSKRYLQSEAKANPVFGGLFKKRRADVEELSARMIAEAESGPALKSKAARKAFVSDFLNREAKVKGGGIWVQIIFAVILPILQKLFESWFQAKEAA